MLKQTNYLTKVYGMAEGWKLERLDKTMLQILRAGTWELMARADVPTGSAISEYVDVAHAFFEKREAKFVNGVLVDTVDGHGIDPSLVADRVVAGIRSEQFLILTHDQHADAICDRAETLANLELPPIVDYT